MLALLAALLLARRMVVPVQALTAGAARIGGGRARSSHRDQDRRRAGSARRAVQSTWRPSCRAPTRRWSARWRSARTSCSSPTCPSRASSRRPATTCASRLHALNLFVAQLRSETRSRPSATRLAVRIEAAVANMNELFNALLDISKLDAGAMSAKHLRISRQRRAEPHRGDVRRRGARKGPATCAWFRAARGSAAMPSCSSGSCSISSPTPCATRQAGGDRRRLPAQGGQAAHRRVRQRHRHCRGSAAQHLQRVLPGCAPEARTEAGMGLGLGLAIVERLGACSSTPSASSSVLGKGSRFSVPVPAVRRACAGPAPQPVPSCKSPADPLRGKLVVVIDDDALVLEASGGLLRAGAAAW